MTATEKKTKATKAKGEKASKPAKAPKAAKAKKEGKQLSAANRPHLYDVLLGPVITEKTTRLSEQNKVVFRIRPETGKKEVKEAVEGLFGVKVTKVNTVSLPGKKKIFRGYRGQRSDTKKAIVTLAAGQSIDFASGVK